MFLILLAAGLAQADQETPKWAVSCEVYGTYVVRAGGKGRRGDRLVKVPYSELTDSMMAPEMEYGSCLGLAKSVVGLVAKTAKGKERKITGALVTAKGALYALEGRVERKDNPFTECAEYRTVIKGTNVDYDWQDAVGSDSMLYLDDLAPGVVTRKSARWKPVDQETAKVVARAKSVVCE